MSEMREKMIEGIVLKKAEKRKRRGRNTGGYITHIISDCHATSCEHSAHVSTPDSLVVEARSTSHCSLKHCSLEVNRAFRPLCDFQATESESSDIEPQDV
eukprot:TRINITY_DN800_c0_g1::TRINITY_DN800_c0_g1_i1::g.25295::m.25295 TRINITY_DN800_c0_g1::TRINITY_DN800_c0_g1_i1::g.25295  ORF type:complete len:100 (+),score=-8.89,Zn_dep_PLPC/PF00882.13/0.11 TRINITY_DN800_c0_g1_i1:1055-1354(+)